MNTKFRPEVLRALRGLEAVEVTMDDLKRTKIGKVVNVRCTSELVC